MQALAHTLTTDKTTVTKSVQMLNFPIEIEVKLCSCPSCWSWWDLAIHLGSSTDISSSRYVSSNNRSMHSDRIDLFVYDNPTIRDLCFHLQCCQMLPWILLVLHVLSTWTAKLDSIKCPNPLQSKFSFPNSWNLDCILMHLRKGQLFCVIPLNRWILPCDVLVSINVSILALDPWNHTWLSAHTMVC